MQSTAPGARNRAFDAVGVPIGEPGDRDVSRQTGADKVKAVQLTTLDSDSENVFMASAVREPVDIQTGSLDRRIH